MIDSGVRREATRQLGQFPLPVVVSEPSEKRPPAPLRYERPASPRRAARPGVLAREGAHLRVFLSDSVRIADRARALVPRRGSGRVAEPAIT
jgi:hypothetical protein